MNMTSSGTFAKRYYAEVLSNPTSTTEGKERAAQKLTSLEKIGSSVRRDRRIRTLQKQLAAAQEQLGAAQARIKELEASVSAAPAERVYRNTRDMLGLPPTG